MLCQVVGICYLFQTSDWPLPNSILSKELIIMSGFPNDFTSEKLKERFPDNVQKVITKVGNLHMNSVYVIDAIWHHKPRSLLFQVMAYCLISTKLLLLSEPIIS